MLPWKHLNICYKLVSDWSIGADCKYVVKESLSDQGGKIGNGSVEIDAYFIPSSVSF